MTRVIIEFDYDEMEDGELTAEDWNRIIEFINQYGRNIITNEVKQ